MLISYGLFKLSCFNPLIGGADRATGGIPPFKKCMTQIAFQSPHRRGGSRDEESLWMTNFSGDEFQSPHRRGGSRDTSVRHHVCEKVGGLFQSPHRRGGSRDGQCNGSCWRAQQGMFQSPHRRGGSRDLEWLLDDGIATSVRFQSPHRRGGSRDDIPVGYDNLRQALVSIPS